MIFLISKNTQLYISIVLSALLYVCVSYFLERNQFALLVLSFLSLFGLTYWILKLKTDSFAFLVGIALLFRLLLLFTMPNLSQDYFRFIWDGRLISEGLNPYIHLPNNLIKGAGFSVAQAQELYNGMGSLSAQHYSNYPPINQFVFLIAAWFSSQSIFGAVVVLRIIIIAADIGTLYFGSKLLTTLGLPRHRIFWYILNPLVIIELTANLHFEGLMLFFFVWSMYLLHHNKWKSAASIMALSIATKLLPLLLLPLFFKKIGFKKSILFYSIVIGLNVILFLPFLSENLIENYSKTIGLWFTNFEFNASMYYIIRALGYYFTGYNIIQTTGKIIPIFIVFFVAFRSLNNKNKTTIGLFESFLIVLSVYFFTATTIHPWYVINIVLVGVFINTRFPLVWSLLVILSYSAYLKPAVQENLYLIALEYTLVFLFVFFDFHRIKNKTARLIATKLKDNR